MADLEFPQQLAPKPGFRLMKDSSPIGKPLAANIPGYSGPVPQKPRFGYEAYVEKAIDSSGSLRGKKNPGGGGRLVMGAGKYKGLTRPETSEAIRGDYAGMSPDERRQYEERANMRDVRSPGEISSQPSISFNPATDFTSPGGQRDTGKTVSDGITGGADFSAPLQTPNLGALRRSSVGLGYELPNSDGGKNSYRGDGTYQGSVLPGGADSAAKVLPSQVGKVPDSATNVAVGADGNVIGYAGPSTGRPAMINGVALRPESIPASLPNYAGPTPSFPSPAPAKTFANLPQPETATSSNAALPDSPKTFSTLPSAEPQRSYARNESLPGVPQTFGNLPDTEPTRSFARNDNLPGKPLTFDSLPGSKPQYAGPIPQTQTINPTQAKAASGVETLEDEELKKKRQASLM